MWCFVMAKGGAYALQDLMDSFMTVMCDVKLQWCVESDGDVVVMADLILLTNTILTLFLMGLLTISFCKKKVVATSD